MTGSNSDTSREYRTGACTIVQGNIGRDNQIDRRTHDTQRR